MTMLTMPEGGGDTFTIVGIDPGTHSLGYAVLTIDVATLAIRRTTAMTFIATKLLAKEAWMTDAHGERVARIAALEEALWLSFIRDQPLMIASESPFFNPGRPMAFGALIEILAAIRQATIRYDVWRRLYLIDPPSVKNAVGARGDGNKDAVKKRILNMAELNYEGPVDISLLDEHSLDAIAVAYARYKSI
jgi:Holliday junction resolvasome RuvABC endonuclease subunit